MSRCRKAPQRPHRRQADLAPFRHTRRPSHPVRASPGRYPLAHVCRRDSFRVVSNRDDRLCSSLANAPTGLASGLTEGLLDEITCDGKFWDGVGNVTGKAAKDTASSFLSGGAGTLTNGLLPENAPGWMGHGTFSTLTGVAKGTAGDVFDGAYSGRWEAVIR